MYSPNDLIDPLYGLWSMMENENDKEAVAIKAKELGVDVHKEHERRFRDRAMEAFKRIHEIAGPRATSPTANAWGGVFKEVVDAIPDDYFKSKE